MNLTDYIIGWTVVNGLFATGILAGLGAWLLYAASARRVVHWRKRHALAAKPAPVAEAEPTPTPTCAVPVITDQERINADLADRKVLWEIEDAFNREHHA